MGILHGQSRCRASDRGAESKINGRKMRSKSRSRELSLKGHFWTPYYTLCGRMALKTQENTMCTLSCTMMLAVVNRVVLAFFADILLDLVLL